MRPILPWLILCCVTSAFPLDLSARYGHREVPISCSGDCDTRLVQVGVGNTHWLGHVLINYDGFYGLQLADAAGRQAISLDGILGGYGDILGMKAYLGIGSTTDFYFGESKGGANGSGPVVDKWTIYFFRLEAGLVIQERILVPVGFVVGGGYDLGIGISF